MLQGNKPAPPPAVERCVSALQLLITLDCESSAGTFTNVHDMEYNGAPMPPQKLIRRCTEARFSVTDPVPSFLPAGSLSAMNTHAAKLRALSLFEDYVALAPSERRRLSGCVRGNRTCTSRWRPC